MKLTQQFINFRFLFILAFMYSTFYACQPDDLASPKVEVIITSHSDKFNFNILSLHDEKTVIKSFFDSQYLSEGKFIVKLPKGNYILVATNLTAKIKIPFNAFYATNEVFVSFDNLEPFPASSSNTAKQSLVHHNEQ